MRILALAMSIIFGAACLGQTLRPGLDVLAIRGATVETLPGQVLTDCTVVVKSGRIAAVGQGIVIPMGADVIEGKGLFVYAGFVDSAVTKGVKPQTGQPRQHELFDTSADVQTSMPIAGPSVLPHVLASDLYDPDDPFWKQQRSAGFASSLLLPSLGVLQGQAALVNSNGKARGLSVIREPVGMSIAFEGFGNDYPGTALGAYSTVRQAFLDASWWQRAGEEKPPLTEPSLKCLVSVRESGTPLLLMAVQSSQIDTAIGLAKELKQPFIVLGANEAYQSELATRGVRVILKIDFANEPGAEEQPSEKPTEPKSKLMERKRLWLEQVNNAKVLVERGAVVSLTTQGCRDSATFWTNLRRMVKEGLPRDAALAALTVNPAMNLGVSSLYGTIEAGKAANLTILDNDFLVEKAKAKFMVIDGVKFDLAKDPLKFSNRVSRFDEEKGR